MKKAKKFLALLMAVAMMATLLVGCGNKPADAGDAGDDTAAPTEAQYVIKIAHTDSSSRSTNVCGEWLNDYLAEATNGQVAVEMYPDGQLGDDPDLAAGVKLGTVTMYFGLASVVSQIVGE